MMLTADGVTPITAAISESFIPASRSSFTFDRFAWSGAARRGFNGRPTRSMYFLCW